MKKILSILLAATMMLSLFVFAACGDDSGEASASVSSSAEEQRSDDDGRVIISGDDPVFSSSPSSASGTGGGNSSASTGGGASTYIPPLPTPSGALTVSVEAPARLNLENCVTTADYIMYQIGELGAITHDGGVNDSLEALVEAEKSYNEFANKAEILSAYSDYLAAARVAYDNKTAELVIGFINDLPDATADNVPTFMAHYDQITALIASMLSSNTSLITNRSLLDSKYSASLEVVVQAFKNAVAALEAATPAYTSAFESLITAAEAAYERIDAQKKSEVNLEKSKLDNTKVVYTNLGIVAAFITKLNALPEASTITAATQEAVRQVISEYKILTADQKSLLDQADETKIQGYISYMDIHFPLLVEDFESGTDGWVITKSNANYTFEVNNAYGSASTGSNSLQMKPKGNGSGNGTLTSEKVYNNVSKITFYFKTHQAGKASVTVKIGETVVIAAATATSAATWQQFTYTATPNAELSGTISFIIAANGSTSNIGAIDDIVVEYASAA